VFCDVYAPRARPQHVGGVAAVKKILSTAFDGVDAIERSPVVLVDLHGYDACPALAALEFKVEPIQVVPNKDVLVNMYCATVCHDEDAESYTVATLCNDIHERCSTKKIHIDNYPDVASLLDALNAPLADPRARLQLKVCAYLAGSNALAIVDTQRERWASEPAFEDLLKQHNMEFNPEALSTSNKRAADEASEPPAAKRMRLVEDANDTLEKVMQLADPCPCMDKAVQCILQKHAA
jgi:hypothetical protein